MSETTKSFHFQNYGVIKINPEEFVHMEQMITDVLLLEKTEGVNIDHLRELLQQLADADK